MYDLSAMPDRPVPVHMGSPRFETHEARSSLVTLLWFPPGAVLEPHVHDRPTFAVILSGGFDLAFSNPAIRRSRLSCPLGTILAQPAGEKHTNYISGDGARGVVLQPNLAADALPRRCASLLDRIIAFRDGPIARAAWSIAREMAVPDGVTPLVIESLVLEMLARAARLDERHELDRDRTPDWLVRAVEFAHDRFRTTVRISDVANAAGVHPAHLAAVFRKVHRVPLGTYLRRLRVDWAAEQLLRTDAPVAAIAAEAGFADQSHLTRAFKRVTGSTPAEYRKIRRTRN